MPLLRLSGKRPSNLGASNGRLADCPNAPKCVHSQTTDRRHAIAPLPLRGDVNASMARLADLINERSDAALVTHTPDYLHAEFTTAMLGFVDDVELLADAQAGVIHVRSCSRLGHSDLGVNRRRVEALRTAYVSGD